MKHTRKLFALLVTLVLASAGFLLWLFRVEKAVVPVDQIEPARTTNTIPVGLMWKLDDRQMYKLSVKSSIQLARSPIHVEVSGTLNSRVIDLKDAVFVAFQIAPVQVWLNGAPAPYLCEVYSNLMISVFDPSGIALEVMTPALLAPQDQKALANMIYSFQCVVPPMNQRASPNRWTLEEKDVNGSFEASYAVSNGLVWKKKEFYSRYANAGTNGISMKVVLSSIQAKIAEKTSWLQDLSGHETLEVFLNTNLLSKSDTSWSIHQIPFAPNPDLAIWHDYGTVEDWLKAVALFGKGDPFSPNHLAAMEQQRLDDLRAKYKDIPVADLISSLMDSIKANKGHTATIPFIHALRDYFMAYPERALEIPEKIKVEKLNDQVAGRIILALELAGNPESQTALSDIHSDTEQASHQRLQALAAIGGVESPTSNSVKRLSELVGDAKTDGLIRDNGWLALGLMSSHSTDDTHKQVCEKLVELSKNKQSEAVALLALDNAGGAPMDLLTNSITSDDPAIRTDVIKNLRHYTNQVSKLLLSNTLANDLDENVRRGAVQIVEQYADLDADGIIREHLSKETSEDIKKEMIHYLGTRSIVPENKQALQSLMVTETNTAVQEAVRKALIPPTYER